MAWKGIGFSIVPRIAFPATPPGVALIPVKPRTQLELGFATRDAEHASPNLRAFVRAIED
jgi:DNA-binding transcriptional LysR family regulator